MLRTSTLGRLALAALLLSGGCEGGGPAGPPSGGDDRVGTEPGNAVGATVGFGGATLVATADDGTVYSLEIPEGALAHPTAITVTPVSRIDSLGLSGGLAGAVRLSPAGLVFARSALLRIETSRAPGAAQRLAAFRADGTFEERALVAAAVDGTEIQVPVPHFTVTGAGFGTTDDLRLFPTFPSTSLDGMFAQLLAIPTPHDAAGQALAHRIGHDAYSQIIRVELVNALNDSDLLDAVSEYDRWRSLLDFIDNGGVLPIVPVGGPVTHRVPAEFAADLDDAASLAADNLRLAIAGNNALCGTQASVEALTNVLFWQSQAGQFGIDEVQEGIDIGTVLSTICARPVLVSSSLPPLVQMGFPHSVDLDFALEFDNGTRIPQNFEVTLTGSNLSIQHPTGFTGLTSVGRYTSVFTAPSAGPFSLSALACWVMPASVTVTGLCGQFQNVGNAEDPPVSVDLTGAWRFSFSGLSGPHCPVASSGLASITQTGNSFHGTWSTVHFCASGITASGEMNGTLALNAVEGTIEVVRWQVSITSFSNPDLCLASTSFVELDGTASLAIDAATGDPVAFGGPATVTLAPPTPEGCPDTIPVSMGLTFCSRTSCP